MHSVARHCRVLSQNQIEIYGYRFAAVKYYHKTGKLLLVLTKNEIFIKKGLEI